jgi:hypothetical protein
MFHSALRVGKSAAPLALGVTLPCTFLALCVWVFVSSPRANPYTVSGTPVQFPTRIPCTPVSDPLHPPAYPNAFEATVVPAPTREWLGVMYTMSYKTSDSPATVVAYYSANMKKEGWTFEWQLTEVLKTPGSTTYDWLYVEGRNLPDVVDILKYAAYCGSASAHPINVYVVVRSLNDGTTQVDLRVH